MIARLLIKRQNIAGAIRQILTDAGVKNGTSFARKLGLLAFYIVRKNLLLGLLVAFTGALAAFFAMAVIIPAWKLPSSRLYPSKLGYPALLHAAHQPLPVSTAIVSERTVSRSVLGEGVTMSTPILVPIVPMDRILAVHVEEGQHVKKGDLLIEIDSTKARIKAHSAELAISTSSAELERVRIGSAYVLAQERPQKDIITQESAKNDVGLISEKIKMAEELEAKGVISHKDVLDARLSLSASQKELKMAEFNLGMSTKGVTQSEIIAENAVEEARNALAQRQRELEDYLVYAPADGIVQQVSVHAGEYNQDSGRPAIVIASGMWFEANVDQGAVTWVKAGDNATVNLQAMGNEPLTGQVKSVIPIVNFDSGGPEATRPARPLGTGAPEWPSTFRVRVEIDPASGAVPGMTGFAKITHEREGIAVPYGAVASLSAGTGIIHCVEDGSYVPREVRCGQAVNGWIEIFSGLEKGDKIITDGWQFLDPKDRIQETPAHFAVEGK